MSLGRGLRTARSGCWGGTAELEVDQRIHFSCNSGIISGADIRIKTEALEMLHKWSLLICYVYAYYVNATAE